MGEYSDRPLVLWLRSVVEGWLLIVVDRQPHLTRNKTMKRNDADAIMISLPRKKIHANQAD